jgi:small subunit ribosomal protein S21
LFGGIVLCHKLCIVAGKEVTSQVAKVYARPDESQDSLLRRFRKEVTRSGVLTTLRKKRWYVSKSEARRRAKKKAIRKARQRDRRVAHRMRD